MLKGRVHGFLKFGKKEAKGIEILDWVKRLGLRNILYNRH